MKKRLLALMLFGLIISQNTLASVSGMVYQDLPVNGSTLNTYGIKDANELGVAGVTVTAYQADGTSQSMVTAADGLWTLATVGDVRVEFSTIPSYLKESPDGGVANSSVQFIADTGVADFGVHDISDYSDTVNPLYVSNLQQNGTHVGSTIKNLHTVHYDAAGLNADYQTGAGVQGTGEIPLDTIMMDEMGSVWGKAYQKDKKRLFVASMLQRHVGFANSPADIYVTDYSSGLPSTLLGNFSLQGKIPANGGGAIDLGTVDRSSGADYLLYPSPLTQNIDLDAYAKVGKIAYGGISVDHENNKLWAINLNQKGIISVDISGDFNSLSSATVNQYLIESLANSPTCTGGVLRPWALKVHNGRGYIGAICDGSISKLRSDMEAFVLSFSLVDPSLPLINELTLTLDYPRQVIGWYAWEDTWVDPAIAYAGVLYGEPVFSDIEFDEHGNIYLAFFDRYATQLGAGNYQALSGTTDTENVYVYGEIMKICNTNGVYEKEGTGSCSQNDRVDTADLGILEFFNDIGGDRLREASLGSLALLKGSNEILHGTEDPHPESTTGLTDAAYWNTQGTHTLSTIDGSIKNWYSNAYTGSQGLNGKANGMGDIELITAPAPTEIGNRVWVDTDGDGVQDAGEAGIENVDVELVCGGVVASTALTDSNGHYIFSNDPILVSTNSHKYNIPELVAGVADCLVRIPDVSGGSKQAALGANNLTTANIGEGSNSNQNDSDGITSGDNAEASITAAEIRTTGANNHSFDFGFRSVTVPAPTGCTTINNTASIIGLDQTDTDSSNDTASTSLQVNCATLDADLELVKTADKSQVLRGDTLTYTLTLTNRGGSDATDVEVTDTLPTGVTFVNATAPSGTSFDDNTRVWTIPSLPSSVGSNVETLQIIVTVD